jgi:hypothetical protein
VFVEVAGVVHVNVVGSAPPSGSVHAGQAFEVDIDVRHFVLPDHDLLRLGSVLEAFRHFKGCFAGWKIDCKFVLGVEEVAMRRATRYARVGRLWGIRFSVRAAEVESRGAADADFELSHRPSPNFSLDLHFVVLAAVGAEQTQFGNAVAVRDVGDALAVGRPARIEVVPVAKGHLVRLAAVDRQHVEIVELGAAVRAVENALTVRRILRLRAVQRLLAQNHFCFCHRIRLDFRAPDRARAQRDATIRNQQHLLSVGRPVRRNMVVVQAEVEPRAAE